MLLLHLRHCADSQHMDRDGPVSDRLASCQWNIRLQGLGGYVCVVEQRGVHGKLLGGSIQQAQILETSTYSPGVRACLLDITEQGRPKWAVTAKWQPSRCSSYVAGSFETTSST